MSHRISTILSNTALLVAAMGASQTAFAYVGPGAGLSLLGALWGLLLAIGAAIAFVILWPIRKARRKARAQQEQEAAAQVADDV